MILKSLAIAGLALSLAAGTAFAGPKGCPPGHARKGECGGGYGYARQDDRRGYERHGHDRHDHGYERHRHRHDWRRGERIPRTRYVVIERYRDYGYQPPPRGYGYVQVDGDVFLIALASGIIADILLRN